MADRRDPRRNTDPARPGDYQYRTSRGPFPASVAADQANAIPDPRIPGRSRYSREYRNEEGHPPNVRNNFAPHEIRPGERLYEIPVTPPGTTRFDVDRRQASLRQVQNAANPHPNDRGRVVRQPLNDPGPYRAVVAADPNGTGRGRGPVGMIEHPTHNPTGYDRVPLEPRDRAGRAMEMRHRDERESGRSSWPPRGESSGDMARMEQRHGRREGGGGRRR